jgi:hypothetical protein
MKIIIHIPEHEFDTEIPEKVFVERVDKILAFLRSDQNDLGMLGICIENKDGDKVYV